MNLKDLDTPERFYQAIPTEIGQNIEYRKNLHTALEKDRGMQETYLSLCLADPKIAFNSMFWTANPRLPVGQRNWPFILRKPKQEELVDALTHGISKQHDVGINKSRDEGATEVVSKTFALLTLEPETYFVVGSRNKDLVDSQGDPYTLFAKIKYAFDTMPTWMKWFTDSITYKDMQISIQARGSAVRG